ncbi:MAG: host specificity protein J, partial [Serratia liquefaciens]
MTAITGSKGGSNNTTTPTESPDSLQSTSYAKILLALGEGEWEGGLDGTNIFLDGTPVIAADGTQNFPGVRWEFRPGTPDQEYIQGMPDVENEITVGTELTSQIPWVRSLTNTQLSAFRLRFSWQQLQQQLDNGDVVGYRIEYAIDVATDGGAYQQMYPTAIDGKTTTKYERSHRIDLPTATTGWQVRVRRLTPNSTSNRIADKMVIESITELIDVKLRYPETVLLFVQFDAKQFQNIPAVSCEPKMGIVRVPTTYDPITRSYTGTWDGSFKWAWTNNPAWVFYDLLVNDRYSIGERIKAENLVMTKFDLYAIAQYCDQLVPDGRGGDGQEPRFLCDAYIQSQEEAWTVLRDFANIFRGMTYWAKNSMNALADMPRDLDYTYTRANVKDGEFRDSSASEKTHYSMAMVSWADPANGYQDAVAPVFENSLIRRYNIKQAEITAIGCTRETEAIRRGRWLLLTNDKDRVINFTVGMDGNIPLPGYIIGVADETLAGRPLGGRISAVSGRNVTLDRESSAAVGERLIVNLPSGKSQARTIQAVSGRIVTVTTAYSETPVAECVWAVDASDLAIQLFRVTGVTENEDGVSFDITAIEHDPNKYARIDTGARIEDRPITVIPPGVQPPPKNVAISSFSTI